MSPDYWILLTVGVIGTGLGVWMLIEAKKYRASRDKKMQRHRSFR